MGDPMRRASSNALLLAVGDWDASEWEQQLRASSPQREVRVWPDRVGDPADIRYACVWKPRPGLLAQFPHLTARMSEYVALHVLLHHRRLGLYRRQQHERRWCDHPQPAAGEVTVGIMGFGVLGRAAAAVLMQSGFQVIAFCRHPKLVSEVELFHGAQGLEAFAAKTEILVCLLPQTPETRGILNLELFKRLKRDGALGGAYLVNAGRGLLQVDADIIAALDQGTLSGASLDVFPVEPLPDDSPLWAHPGIIITPHNAAVSDPRALTANVLAQMARFERGLALQNVVNRRAGY